MTLPLLHEKPRCHATTMSLSLHWGRTLQNKEVQLRHRSQYNLSGLAPAQYPGYNLSTAGGGATAAGDDETLQIVFPWRQTGSNSSGSGNYSILHAENQFLKKSRVLSDIMEKTGTWCVFFLGGGRLVWIVYCIRGHLSGWVVDWVCVWVRV